MARKRKVDADIAQRVREQVDNYQNSVFALLCFRSLWLFDAKGRDTGARSEFGRRMDTSGERDTLVTPDLVLQSGEYKMVAELKASMARDESRWGDDVAQLEKYSRIVAGWWEIAGAVSRCNPGTPAASEEKVNPLHDSIALIEIARAKRFARVLGEALSALSTTLIDRRIAVVEFARADQLNQHVFFRVHAGIINHSHGLRLEEEGVKVPLGQVLEAVRGVRFCDFPPPTEYMAQMIWKDYLNPLAARSLSESGADFKEVPVSVEDIASELRKAFGSSRLDSRTDVRSVPFPQNAWVRAGLELLVRVGYARSATQDEKADFVVSFRAIRGDLLGHFATLAASAPVAKPEQMELL